MNKKIIIFITLFIIVLIPTYKVEAKTLGDLRKELSNLEAKYEENKNNKKLTDEQIVSLTSEINVITGKVNSIKSDIKKTEDDINTNQKKIEEKKDETDELLKFLQVSSGENVYLEYIFQADSYTDFIYRYSVASQLTEYNDNLMNELTKLVEELENADLYQVFLLMNLTKIKELSINTKIKKERDFYNKLYEMVLQTRQVELIEKGVF